MNTDFRYVILSEGVGAVEQSPTLTGISNCGVIHTREGTVLIDSLMTPRLAGRMCDATGLEDDRVRHIIVTHGHIDHVGGHSVFGRADVWGTPRTMETVRKLPGFLDICARWMPAWADELRSTPLVVPGRELPPGRWTGPSDEFGIRILDFGCAHSESDVAIFLEARGVLFAGDLAFFGITPMLLPGGSLRGWIAALDHLIELPTRCIVPGHGPVGDGRQLAELRRYFVALLQHAAECFSAGLTIDEAIDRLPPTIAHAPGWAEPQRTAINLYSAYCELQGPPPAEDDGIERIFSELHGLLSKKSWQPAFARPEARG